ncbi:hypothetical protein G6F43_006432 [Rhizopus delemar]|nr:hypothetical protein G6F43_006432 [Rhizopus delemar]
MLEDFDHKEERLISAENKQFTAAKHLEPGITLFIEPSLVSIPLPSKRHQRCNYCLSKAQLQCCSRCRSAYFCGNACFRNAWLHFHRVLCEPQATDNYVHVNTDQWLLERAALTLSSHYRMNKQQSPHLAFALKALKDTPNLCNNPPEWLERVAELLKPQDISAQELAALYGQIQACTFPIFDFEHHMEQMAVGLYPITALHVKHSCRPNSAVVYKQGKQHLITIETIQPGDPITIAYVDMISNKKQRSEQLKKRFGKDYECTCARCIGNLSGIDALLEKGDTIIPTEEQGREFVSRCIKEWSVLNMSRLVEQKDTWSPMQIMGLPPFAHFIGKIVLPDVHAATIGDKKRQQNLRAYVIEDKNNLLQRLPVAIEALSNVPQVSAFTTSTIHSAELVLIERIKAGKWVEASRCSLYLLVAYCLLYPPLHPKMAYHSLIFARSCWNALVEMELIGIQRKLEKVYAGGTRTWIEWAKVSVDLTFGRETGLWREVVELQWVFDREQKVKSCS